MRFSLELVVRAAFLIGVLWSVIAGVAILLSPVMVESATADIPEGEGAADRPQPRFTVERRTWYQVQGAWGVAVLVLFSAAYGGAAALIWRRSYLAGTTLSLLAAIMTVLAGFSIGLMYLPAAVAVLLGLLILGLAQLTASDLRSSQ